MCALHGYLLYNYSLVPRSVESGRAQLFDVACHISVYNIEKLGEYIGLGMRLCLPSILMQLTETEKILYLIQGLIRQPNYCINYTDVSSDDELKAFFAESLIMKDFNHPNVLGLTGVCFDTPDGYPYLILPFMINGSLKDYLRNSRVNLKNVDTFPKVSTK